MKTKSIIAIALVALLGLAGCATMLKTMGVATQADLEQSRTGTESDIAALRQTVDALSAKAEEIAALSQAIEEVRTEATKVADLATRIDELSAKVDESASLAAELPALKAALAELQGKLDQVPAETLARLAAILADALKRSGASTP